MAEKMIFLVSDTTIYEEDYIEYDYSPGFATSQKQKNIATLHSNINKKYRDKKILEISTKSQTQIGIELSAFNLQFWHKTLNEYRTVENVFQASKKFESGGPYNDLLNLHPSEAKRDSRLTNSGALKSFELYGEEWELEPKTMFYDWIYINALLNNEELSRKILDYDIFTDIEFNYKKSINCQARSAAIFVGLKRKGQLEYALDNQENFKRLYKIEEQLTLF